MKCKCLNELVRLAVLISIVGCSVASAAAQSGIPVYVTMKSSHRFDGVLEATAGFSTKIEVASGSASYRIDNGLRRVYVNKRNVTDAEPVPQGFTEIEFEIWQDGNNGRSLPGIMNFTEGFNEFGHRRISVSLPRKPAGRTYVQGISRINPRYIELSSLRKEKDKSALTMSIGQGAVPPEVIRTLLHNQIARSDSPIEYEEIFLYFQQAQQYPEALKELDLIERRFPDRKEQVKRNRQLIRQDQARQVIREMNTRVRNGQFELAKELGGPQMNKDGVAPNLLLELQDILDELNAADAKVVDVRKQVGELVKGYQGDPATKLTADQETMLGQFLAELETELRPSNVGRMDSYLVQAPDPAQKDQEKVALAISGWLMGSNNATPNFALAQSLFQVRALIYEYLRDGDPNQRKAILDAIKKTESGSNVNFVSSMLAQMIPPEHGATEGYTGEKPIEFTVTVPGTSARPGDQNFKVLVHLPAEYDPYHRYPLMLTLPDIGVSVEQQLDKFNEGYLESIGRRVGRASRAGVIVASVQWANPGQTTPSYSAREHATVRGAMRACFRKFQINTDRVFLHGNGKGANLVYDVGLAHPDHFAALIPVGGVIEKYAKVHATNKGIPLSIYAVVGGGDFETQKANRETWDKWLLKGKFVNLILVEYRGRLAKENFPDDHEAMFEWMEFQRRRLPDPTGVEFAVNSSRPWDNYYWFMQVNGFPLANVTWPALWGGGKLDNPALDIIGEMKAQGAINHFVVKPAKAGRSMTLWLSDDYVDFTKAVRITGRSKFNGGVSPSVAVMLEDTRIRCDRLHPYWARLDCNSGKWQVAK